MTTVEKRRSGRKSGGRRKHSDGGYSDTSSCGSFLDENDREVSNLTDRAFRSLCIGDEAVYNDSDLGLSSPSTQRDKQLAFSRDREREELKRAAHENFSLRVQQYEQDWIHGGMYGAEIHRDPQWEVYGERTQGRVSATFQHSFVETSQQEKSLREEQLSILSNGASEVNPQQLRSRSRVSSLIRAFNSEGHSNVAGMDREMSDETSWDKSALMSIQRELSEFSTSYQHNFNSGHFPTAGPFSPPDTNFYSSEVAAVAHMSHNSAAAFMRSSHSKHSMSAQVNCNSNFFIHSEFSPFKVWRDHNRFPFQHGQVSGFMPRSEFPKWYETPMYKELSLHDQPQAPYRGGRHTHMAPVVPPAPLRSTSTSTVMQKAPAVEKRCESELAGHYPHRKRTQSLGANRLPSQRPSTASPTSEMSRCVRDTISSVKALQQKIKMMAEQNVATGVIPNPHGQYYTNDNSFPFGTNAGMMAQTAVSSSTAPFNISQMPAPSANAHHDEDPSNFQHYDLTAPPVEHAPVRAESRGATPDVRMSSYRSRASSLLFNLKDNRKRVKSTYSPPKFKGTDTQEKYKRPPAMEPRDTVIDIPDFVDPYNQFPPLDESNRTHAAAYQYANQYQSSMLNPLPAPTHAGQYPEYMYDDQTAQMQGQMVHHSGFTGFIPENYTSNQLTNGQNLHQDLASFAPYKQGGINNVASLGGDVYRLKPPYTAAETSHFNAESNQGREYLLSQTSAVQPLHEPFGRVLTNVDRYEHVSNNQHDYNDAFSQDRHQQVYSQNTEKLSLKANQESAGIMGKTRLENQPNINKEVEKAQLRESFAAQMSSHNISNGLQQFAMSNNTVENPAYYGQQQTLAFQDKIGFQKYPGHYEDNQMKDTYKTQNNNSYIDQDYRSQHAYYPPEDKLEVTQETGHRKPNAPNLKGHETQIMQPIKAEVPLEPNIHTHLLSNPDSTYVPAMTNQIKDGQIIDAKAEEVIAETIRAGHAQAELAQAQQKVQVELPRVESAGLILAEQTGSEIIRTEQAKTRQPQQELVKQDKAENIKEEKKKEQTQESSEKQNIVQKKANEPQSITDGVDHARMKQSNQVTVEQAEKGKLTEKHTSIEPTNIAVDVQTKTIQAQHEQATSTTINTEPVGKEELSKVQVGRERAEAEQIRTETVNVNQAGTESRKAEQTIEQIKKQQTKAEPEKTKVAEQEKLNTDRNKTQDVGQVKYQRDLVQADAVKVKQPATLISSAKETKVQEKKAEEMKLERSKVEGFKAELTKGENMEERSAKLTAKLNATHAAKREPDRVEKVKTELAKAKAELAKIKEKMRGEQKEKVKNTAVVKEDVTAKTNVNSKLNLNKTEDHNRVEREAQIQHQKEVSAVRNISSQPDRGAEEYHRLREKYGFIDAVSTDKTKVSATGNVASLDNNGTQTLPPCKAETVTVEKSTEECSPTSKLTANTENKKELDSFKSSEVTESQYVYSESSKEFKLFFANDPPTDGNKGGSANNVKDDIVEKLGKYNPVKDTEVSLQKHSDSTKVPPPERKTKLSEHSGGPVKELQLKTPPKALNHKERAQTKQEILTSKILAHAEKEISAIKEKGFAMRDGSKSSNKHLPGGQSVNIRQKPPPQDLHKKHESTMSRSVASKQQMGVSGAQLELVPSASPSSSATAPVKSSATNTQPVDTLLKQVSQKTTENNSGVPEPSLKSKPTGSDTVSATSSFVQNEKQENPPEQESSMQTEEKAPKVEQVKPQTKHEALPEKQKELVENPDLKTNTFNRKKEDLSETTQAATEQAQSIGAPSEDPTTPPHLILSQKESPVADDSLQIMGIMIRVQDSKQSLDLTQMNYSTQNLVDTTEKECHSSSGLDKRQDTTAKEGKVKGVQKTHSAVREDQSRVEPENAQKTSTSGTSKDNVTEDTTETNQQQGSSFLNEKPRSETKPDPQAEKEETVSVAIKDKVLAETQPPLYKPDTKARHTKESAENKSTKADEETTEEKKLQVVPAPHTKGNLNPKHVNSEINEDNGKAQMKQGDQASVTEDKTAATVQSKNSNRDNNCVPLLDEKRHDSTPPRAFNKASENTFTGTENKDASPKHQDNESHQVINEDEDDVHIGSIAIRVVPPSSTNDNIKVMVTHQSITSPSEVALSNEHEAASSSCKESSSVLPNEDPPKSLSEASSEEKIKDSLEDKLGVKPVLVSAGKVSDLLKMNNQQSSKNEACENTQLDHGETDKVKKGDEANIPPVEEDYFQVRGVKATSNEPHCSAAVGDTPKERELPATAPNMAALSTETIKDGKNDAFVFKVDQEIGKTVDSTSGRFPDESAKGKNCETEEKLASKMTDGSMGRWSDNKKMEAGQTHHIRKDHTERDQSTSVTERQSSRSSHPKRESRVIEKPEAKSKPKERTSTIPEISALADYARLKVIVSEEKDVNPVQEFPHNKKEGFFPLIHSRHSRRPVFTVDPQENSVKEKTSPNKTEMTVKVNKEPKALVFPITEKEHQRTGMFKLGDKERQDKMSSEGKVTEDKSDDVGKHAQHKDRNDLPKAQTELTARAGTQRASHVKLTGNQQHKPPLQDTAASDLVTRSQNTSERLTYLDKTPPSLSITAQTNDKENLRSLRKGERTEREKTTGSESEDGQNDKPKNKKPATQQEETKAKQQGKIKQPEEEQASRKKEEGGENDMKIKHMLEESRASQAEEERRAIQREEERRAREREAIAIKIKERREKQREAERGAEKERQENHREKQKAAQKEEAIKSRQIKEDMGIKETGEKRRIKTEEESRAKLRVEEEKRKENERKRVKQQEEDKAAQEQRRAAQVELQRKAVKEQQKLATQEEQKRRAAREEQQRRAAKEEQQRRAAQEEQQRKLAREEQQRRAAYEQQRQAVQEEQQRRAEQEEQQRRAEQEEQQRRAEQEEQQRRAAQEEQQRRAEQEEQQRRAEQEKQQRRSAREEQQRRAAQEEQQRRAEQEEQQRRAAREEQQRIATEKEQQLKAVEEEQQRRAAYEQQRRAAQEEQKRATEKEQQRAAKENQRKAAQEQQRRARQIEMMIVSNEDTRGEKENDDRAAHISEEKMIKQIMESKAEQQTEDKIHRSQDKEEWIRIQKVEEEQKKIQKEREIEATEQRTTLPEKSQADEREDERTAQEQMLLQRDKELQDKKKKEEKLAAQREKIKAVQVEKQRRAAQTDGLQYYAITSTEPERKSKERQLNSPLPSQHRHTPSIFESPDRPYRPHAPASPASSLPRSTTSSPALGFKPSMFKVKDNTFRGSSLTKSVKPRFYKNFGEDYWGGEEQEIMRRSAGTPVYPEPGSNRLSAINEPSTTRSVSSLDGYSAPGSYHRPYSRRSIAVDDDDSRSVFSTTSEGVESFATSAADLADIRGLYDYDRPESACSFSSDVSRSLGKPPTVPPKSEKALRKAQRLTTRRIKKELSKLADNNPAELQKEDNIIPPSSSTEVRSSSRHAVASPHFSQPVSLAHAQTVGSSLPSSHAEHQPSHRSFHASPHATGPISLPNSSAHATAALTHPAAPKTVSHAPSSNALHHVNHPAPVTQYQVESSYPQSYPLTQRKVLQDLGSGQYFVVDVPVEVKTKTFIDPETGKYVQLNVRESGQSIPRHQPQQTHPQSQLQPQRQIKPQQQPISRASPAGKPAAHYQGYHGYPNSYQPTAIHSVHSNSSTAPVTGQQGQQPAMRNHSYGYPAPETGDDTEGCRYSPEKTPYMDTVNDMDKAHNRFYGTQGSYESFPECDTNSQLAGRSVCETDNSAHSQNQPREIIPMSELEDFMEISDW